MNSPESRRIREEYNRRRREIPQDYYSNRDAGNYFICTRRWRAAKGILEEKNFFPLKSQKILEVGCGYGAWLNEFKGWGCPENCLSGIDQDPERFQIAKSRLPEADLRLTEASTLPWKEKTFDLVLQATLFTSVLDQAYKKKIADEMMRVLKPSGIILWYDFFCNNPWNPNVKGIGRAEIKTLFSNCKIEFHRTTLALPLAKRLAPISPALCSFLENLRILNTHYLALICKK